MTLIKSISGIRGTIGGKPGENLTPPDIVAFACAYASFIKTENPGKQHPKIFIGRDARPSGPMVSQLVANALLGFGIDVVDLGLSTTPSVEVAVTELGADGGIILTASHNPVEWNALKLLNNKGEFISGKEGEKIIQMAENSAFEFVPVDALGTLTSYPGGFISEHIQKILALKDVNIEAIRAAGISVVVDAVASTGGIAIPMLLERLGVKTIHKLHCEPHGKFPHNPEPLPEHLTEISQEVVTQKADMGIVVDPDVDRLAFISEDGSMFGEEYTLVAVADYILEKKGGNTVSNLSSTRALADVTTKHGYTYAASAVGEVNVVVKMKETNAVIGGEGNGGIIYPELHYGRDALVGLALFLSYYAEKKQKMTVLKANFPQYAMSKNKIELPAGTDVDALLMKISPLYKEGKMNTEDGLKIDLEKGWMHLRKSNTEPIIRIYTEALNNEEAALLAEDLKKKVMAIL